MSTPLRYGFPSWARRHVEPCTPAELTRYFEDRGVYRSKEFWRKLLRGHVRAAKLETWVAICDATGEPLSTFLAYEPDGRPPAPRPRKKPARRAQRKADSLLPPPPDPRRYFEGLE